MITAIDSFFSLGSDFIDVVPLQCEQNILFLFWSWEDRDLVFRVCDLPTECEQNFLTQSLFWKDLQSPISALNTVPSQRAAILCSYEKKWRSAIHDSRGSLDHMRVSTGGARDCCGCLAMIHFSLGLGEDFGGEHTGMIFALLLCKCR